MSIKSYLAHPHQGQKQKLMNELLQLPNCDVIPATNQDVLILVTDTSSKLQEDEIKQKLETISSLKLLAMVSGFQT